MAWLRDLLRKVFLKNGGRGSSEKHISVQTSRMDGSGALKERRRKELNSTDFHQMAACGHSTYYLI